MRGRVKGVRPDPAVVSKYKAMKGDERYVAHCTSTYRRLEHEVWKVVQHQQTPPLTAEVRAADG